MLNYKELAENILSDLMNSGSISDVLLKTKIFASQKRDVELLDWVTKELNGYDEKPPKYRILNSGLRVVVHVPYQGIARLDFPIDVIENKKVRDRLSNMAFTMPLTEIENLCKDANKRTISMKVPVCAYSVMSGFVSGEIQDAYQYATTAAVSQIVVSVKSVLVDFLLKISNEEDINFNSFIKSNPQMITINNSGIMHTGSGDVKAQGAMVVRGDNNVFSAGNKQELMRILAEIDKMAIGHSDSEYEDVSREIKTELQKENPEKKLIKRCFQAIPSFLSGVGTSIIGNQLTPLISRAIFLL